MINSQGTAGRERPSINHAINIPRTRRSARACPWQANPYGVPVSDTPHPHPFAGLLIAGLLLTGCGTSAPTPVGTAATPTEPAPAASSAPTPPPPAPLEPHPAAANPPDDP